MSKVLSFRLDPNNEREASAIAVLIAWQNKGYSLRLIIAEALLKMDNCKGNSSDEQISILSKKLDVISDQIQSIGIKNLNIENTKRESCLSELSQHFVDTIIVSLKPGVRLLD